MPYEYEDEAEIYRIEPMSLRLAQAVLWGIVVGTLTASAIILIAAYL